MLFMEIYESLGNANVINIYLQHVSKWPSCPRFAFKIKLLHLLEKKKKYRVIQNLLCTARAHNDVFFWGGGEFSVTLVEDFSPPPPRSPPLSLNISLYVCLSLDEGAASRAALLSYRSVSLKNVNCSTD